ncbi:MAG: polyprenyl synthetase family protein [Lautropia sp.]
MDRIERALTQAVDASIRPASPPRLGDAMRFAVFPGGARVRPRLCLAVALACGDDQPAVSDAAAVAIELLHCASLVHDDLPCFDDADLRRGKPSVHVQFEERIAILAGDALIVLAFETLARGACGAPHRLAPLVSTIAAATGMPWGIVAGQAWECEPQVELVDYHQAKTGSLFAAAATAGALAAGAPAEPWQMLGERLGEAYQVADDIRDVVASVATLGKPAGRDAALGRPSVVQTLGADGARQYFATLMDAAAASIPECPGAGALRELVRRESQRLLPQGTVLAAG